MSAPKVSIVIVNWNGGNDTIECLESIKKLSYPNYEIIVVDNGSTDGSQELIKKSYSYVKLIENKANLGFCIGCNIGLRYAMERGTDYFLLLNNDTIVDTDMLNELVKVAENDKKIGIVGPKIYYYNKENTIWFCGGIIDMKRGKIDHIDANRVGEDQSDKIKETDYVTGAALLIKRHTVEKIGLLDPVYFAYFEDADWNIRAKKAGFKIVYNPKAKVWHKVAKSTGGGRNFLKSYYMTKNRILFMKKHVKARYYFMFFCRFLYTHYTYAKDSMFRPKNHTLSETRAGLNGTLWGLIDGLLGKWGKWERDKKFRVQS